MSFDVDAFDLDAAILRKNEQDLRTFFSALAVRLETALPGQVEVERKRDGLFSSASHVVRIALTTGDACFAIALDRSGAKTTKAKVVRGVVISTTQLPPGAWMTELRSAVASLSGASDDAASTIGKFL